MDQNINKKQQKNLKKKQQTLLNAFKINNRCRFIYSRFSQLTGKLLNNIYKRNCPKLDFYVGMLKGRRFTNLSQ